jgi:hypothetical protein
MATAMAPQEPFVYNLPADWMRAYDSFGSIGYNSSAATLFEGMSNDIVESYISDGFDYSFEGTTFDRVY